MDADEPAVDRTRTCRRPRPGRAARCWSAAPRGPAGCGCRVPGSRRRDRRRGSRCGRPSRRPRRRRGPGRRRRPRPTVNVRTRRVPAAAGGQSGRWTRRRRRGSAARRTTATRRRRPPAPSPARRARALAALAVRRRPRRRTRSRPSPARTQTRGKDVALGLAPVHDEHGPVDVTPPGTSTKIGSGVKASLSRTRASPPCCTDPTCRRTPATSSAGPNSNAVRHRCRRGHVPGTERPSCTSTLAAVRPRAVRSDSKSSLASGDPAPAAGPVDAGRRSRRAPARRSASSARPPRFSEGSGVDEKAS